MPAGKGIHTRKFDKCVKKVSAKGRKVNPYAVCTARLGYKASILKSHRRKGIIPLRRSKSDNWRKVI